jgi:hypothetical protein
MDVGDWKSLFGLGAVYNDLRSLGLESNIAELEAFGFTVVPADKLGVPVEFTTTLLKATLKALRDEEVLIEKDTSETRKPYGGLAWHLLDRPDDVFLDALLNPVVQLFATYLIGAERRLFAMNSFVKEGETPPTYVHCDAAGVPPPLPAYATVCNVSWLLSDYTQESGTLAMMPGSHRFCRHPGVTDRPQFMSGPADNDLFVPVSAPAGSLIVFHGNTWHGTYPKATHGIRAHIAMVFCRSHVRPGEDYSDLSEVVLRRGGPILSKLLGREAWQGWKREGPNLGRLTRAAALETSAYA